MAYFTFQRILKMVIIFFYYYLYQKLYLINKDPKNVDALLGLAVLEFRNENYKKYYECLEKSYEIDKTSPFLLLHIAEFFLMRHDLEKVIKQELKW